MNIYKQPFSLEKYLPRRLGDSTLEKSIERTTCGLSLVSVKTGRFFVTVAVSMPPVTHGLCKVVSLPGIGSIDTPSSSVIVPFSRCVSSFDGVKVTYGTLCLVSLCTAEPTTLFVFANTLFPCAIYGDANDDVAVTDVVVLQPNMAGLCRDLGVTGVQAGVLPLSAARTVVRGVLAATRRIISCYKSLNQQLTTVFIAEENLNRKYLFYTKEIEQNLV